MKIKFLIVVICVVMAGVMSNSQVKEDQNEDAIKLYWYSRVSEEAIRSQKNKLKLDETNSKIVIDGIKTLLTFEGDSTNARFCGATDVKYNSPEVNCSVEVAALFYASYIFYGKEWDHFATGIALVENRAFNSPETIKKAYEHYRRWLEKVKEIGLEEARRTGLDPLKGTGIAWYGGMS